MFIIYDTVIILLYSLRKKIISDSAKKNRIIVNHINCIERKIMVRDRAADKCQFNAPVRIAPRKGPKNKTIHATFIS